MKEAAVGHFPNSGWEEIPNVRHDRLAAHGRNRQQRGIQPGESQCREVCVAFVRRTAGPIRRVVGRMLAAGKWPVFINRADVVDQERACLPIELFGGMRNRPGNRYRLAATRHRDLARLERGNTDIDPAAVRAPFPAGYIFAASQGNFLHQRIDAAQLAARRRIHFTQNLREAVFPSHELLGDRADESGPPGSCHFGFTR
jgi:hypothetical protein